MTLFSNEFEGLAGFEELPSYKIIKQTKKNFVIEDVKDGIVKKRKTLFKPNMKKKAGKIKDGSKTLVKELARRKSEKRKWKENNYPRKILHLKGNENPNESLPTNSSDEDACTQVKDKECLPSETADTTNKTLADLSGWKSIFIPDVLLDAIAKLGFSEPTEIQKLTIPSAIKGRKDIVGAAETGSGKTLAFAIPIIHGIIIDKQKEKLFEKASDTSLDNIDSSIGPEDLSSENESEYQSAEENISEPEEDFEDANSVSPGLGCVKVIDNANFDFLQDDSSGIKKAKNPLRSLIITPTRELAVQIKKHIDALLCSTNISTAVVIGGLSQEKQERILAKGPDIVIGTPGRLWQMIQMGNFHLGSIESVKYLAIDEADRLLESGHFEELRKLLGLLNSDLDAQKKRQNFIFSATLTLEHDVPDRFTKRLKKKQVTRVTSETKMSNLVNLVGLKPKYKTVDATLKTKTAQNLSEGKILCDHDEKEYYLYYFLMSFPGRTLVFCNSIDCVRRLSNLFTLLKRAPQALHASKHQRQRLKSLEKFSSTPEALLLATDVAARGLDIPNINHIIHYEVPKTAETYIHRSGRTARAQKGGLSIILLSPSEVGNYLKICSTLERNADLASFPVDNIILEQVKERVNLAKQIEIAEFRSRKEGFNNKWLQEAGEDFTGKRHLSIDEEEQATLEAMHRKKKSKQVKLMKHRLNETISLPILSSEFSSRYPTRTGALVLPDQGISQHKNDSALKLFNKESEEYFRLAETIKFKPPIKIAKAEKKREKDAKKRQRRLKKKKENKKKNL